MPLDDGLVLIPTDRTGTVGHEEVKYRERVFNTSFSEHVTDRQEDVVCGIKLDPIQEILKRGMHAMNISNDDKPAGGV
jgi:hypothetical protein